MPDSRYGAVLGSRLFDFHRSQCLLPALQRVSEELSSLIATRGRRHTLSQARFQSPRGHYRWIQALEHVLSREYFEHSLTFASGRCHACAAVHAPAIAEVQASARNIFVVVHAHEPGSITTDHGGSGTVPNSRCGDVSGSRSSSITSLEVMQLGVQRRGGGYVKWGPRPGPPRPTRPIGLVKLSN